MALCLRLRRGARCPKQATFGRARPLAHLRRGPGGGDKRQLGRPARSRGWRQKVTTRCHLPDRPCIAAPGPYQEGLGSGGLERGE